MRAAVQTEEQLERAAWYVIGLWCIATLGYTLSHC